MKTCSSVTTSSYSNSTSSSASNCENGARKVESGTDRGVKSGGADGTLRDAEVSETGGEGGNGVV